MTLEEALVRRQLAASSIAAIVGARIDWDRRPQGAALPAITLDLISETRSQTFKGLQRLRATRVQWNGWAATKAAAIALRRAALPILVAPATVGDVQFQRAQSVFQRATFERTDTGAELYRELLDITFWHNASD